MNNKISITYLILMIAPLVFGCRGTVKEENENASASSVSLHVGNDKYIMIDTKESVVTWKGSNLNGLNTQTGYVYISKGELMIENGQLVGGTVEIDMNTIEDKNHRSDNNLVNHLKDPDFFEVKKFPFATIVITKVALINGENKNITGNLTIKGITHPVTFPAKMEVKDGIVRANGKLVIDRTLWDVRYKSAKFYDNLANQTMSDSIEFYIKIVAKK
ncbi:MULTISPECIES: YceI family protein [unclassified Arcicella]|uniref:YceI family protein n=1 Tax=unclassified Arcicella TaxID=2644986 RepID=UPI002865926B|nr:MULTISPECIES: YceI family protein [unclassified Arcicella]MDR6560025.1 polyisoprenoid-binding protein YceI [Arcicella sp. BE51]MDR6810368.1 polyisoprenoid-binding protein YceI [Arcicella sp. BE140]MDR6821718.1 polyisoprenoid-binding protein YceI [Arcicella sp. BE139]